MAENYISKISVNGGTPLDIHAAKATSVESFSNLTPYELDETSSNGKLHKGVQLKNNGCVGYVELGSTGNIAIEARGTVNASGETTSLGVSGNTNIEATKQIKLKPTTKIIVDSSRRIQYKDENKVNIEFAFDDYKDCAEGLTGTLYSGKNSTNEAWAETTLKARSLDLRCNDHGGVAVQPAGADSSNHINKIKFEHSLKVPVEHFAEYTITDPTSVTVYNYPETDWVYLCATIDGKAVQLLDQKVLKATLADWNDGIIELSNAKHGIKADGIEYQIGYATVTGATSEAILDAYKADNDFTCSGKHLYVKRLAIAGSTLETMPAVKVATVAGETKFKDSTASSAIVLVPETTGTPETTISEGSIIKGSFEAIIKNSKFKIDGIEYQKTETYINPTAATAQHFTITDKKFTITPVYPVHFNTEGGKGIEWGTFNPLHTSLYSADYRFKKDAPVYAVNRTEFEITSSKCDYKTQADDTKDNTASAESATWAEIIAAAKGYAALLAKVEALESEIETLKGYHPTTEPQA